MDAGLRDNFGLETALRFTHVFREWITNNTSGVVLVQIRDRQGGGWEYPFESKAISEVVTKPMLLLQYNWYKMQQYNQQDQLSFASDIMNGKLSKLTFQYVPDKLDSKAALNFHLTKREKMDIIKTLDNSLNRQAFLQFGKIILPDTVRQTLSVR